MELNDSDDETIEFSIEIVESTSSISLDSLADEGEELQQDNEITNSNINTNRNFQPPEETTNKPQIIQAVEVEFKVDQQEEQQLDTQPEEEQLETHAEEADVDTEAAITNQTVAEIEPPVEESEVFEKRIPDDNIDTEKQQLELQKEDRDKVLDNSAELQAESLDELKDKCRIDLENEKADSAPANNQELEDTSEELAVIEIVDEPTVADIKTKASKPPEPPVALEHKLVYDTFQLESILQTCKIELVEKLACLTTGELEPIAIPIQETEEKDDLELEQPNFGDQLMPSSDIELEVTQVITEVNDSGVSADLEPESLYESEKNEIDGDDLNHSDKHDDHDGDTSRVENSSSPQIPEISIDVPATTKTTAAITAAVPEVNRELQPSLCAKYIEEDLEREFDEEPEFIQRNVELKRNCDPRQEYDLSEELGRGRFGTVFRCTERQTGKNLAAKFIHMRRKEDREDVEREVWIMSQLQHKRLLQLYDAFDDGKSQMCLITELVDGGELFERIIDDDFDLTEKKAAIFMRQICEGVEYMHSQRIVHLDMKPENILCLSKTGNRIKLIDFGLARQLNSKEPLRVMFGTPDFAAPEVLAYDVVTLATDMWSVGVICYVLLSGLSPFMGDNDMETMANVLRATYDFNDDSFDPISDLAKDFIAKLLVKDPGERLRPSECLKHPWLQRGGNQLDASLKDRRKSSVATMISGMDASRLAALAAAAAAQVAAETGTGGDYLVPTEDQEDDEAIYNKADDEESLGSVSLSKRNLKRYVVRRRWHKTVHAIMALGRMGANLKLKMGDALNSMNTNTIKITATTNDPNISKL